MFTHNRLLAEARVCADRQPTLFPRKQARQELWRNWFCWARLKVWDEEGKLPCTAVHTGFNIAKARKQQASKQTSAASQDVTETQAHARMRTQGIGRPHKLHTHTHRKLRHSQ